MPYVWPLHRGDEAGTRIDLLPDFAKRLSVTPLGGQRQKAAE